MPALKPIALIPCGEVIVLSQGKISRFWTEGAALLSLRRFC
jgi:hypothetical protein